MKTILALGAGVVLALAPSTAASAAAEPFATGSGKAYGNCQHSSAGGTHEPLEGSAGNGNGGHVRGGVKPQLPCVPVQEEAPVETGDTSGDDVDWSGYEAT